MDIHTGDKSLSDAAMRVQLSQFIEQLRVAATELEHRLAIGVYSNIPDRVELMQYVAERCQVPAGDFAHTLATDLKALVNETVQKKGR
jgi:hypothetical protein